MTAPERFIAIDWSGNAQPAGQRNHIWTADLGPAHVHLFADKTRGEVCDWLIAQKDESQQPLAVGLDFAFSLPASFFRQRGYSTVEDLWQAAAADGEDWLRSCEPPFWGRPGKPCPPTHPSQGFRGADRAININGIAPKSPFQIGGAGSVGTGSLRGMPILHRLRDAGFSIWPFHLPAFPVVVEIYPRLLTGPVNKSDPAGRLQYLARPEFAPLPPAVRQSAHRSEDAFDALVSAVRMREFRSSFAGLTRTTEPIELLEGRIWQPQPSSPNRLYGNGKSVKPMI